ncbi:unnamed protein product [Acanthosepion pharaonis]|uniref:Uncharacterized protein n=1 Tax=Acanthosepion pharaonis TaxID=158019 RepID=A0A812BRK9_ACAPH|nr:unnamed protein product [Sepia pharaonis]
MTTQESDLSSRLYDRCSELFTVKMSKLTFSHVIRRFVLFFFPYHPTLRPSLSQALFSINTDCSRRHCHIYCLIRSSFLSFFLYFLLLHLFFFALSFIPSFFPSYIIIRSFFLLDYYSFLFFYIYSYFYFLSFLFYSFFLSFVRSHAGRLLFILTLFFLLTVFLFLFVSFLSY